jgi:hypothetical protein
VFEKIPSGNPDADLNFIFRRLTQRPNFCLSRDPMQVAAGQATVVFVRGSPD